jgi:transposase InsO family protein
MTANDIRHGTDTTLARNNYKYLLKIFTDYEEIKQKKHVKFRFVTDLLKHYNLKRQNFYKYYNRFKQKRDFNSVIPHKRGPKFKRRKLLYSIEERLVNLRHVGFNRYEIQKELKQRYKKFAPSSSTIYNIFKDRNLNRLQPKMKQNKRKIIKEKAGELAHIDCHYLPKGLFENDNKRYYLVAITDDATRITWVDFVTSIKSITVMFTTLELINMFRSYASIEFKELLSDNGSEFGGGPNRKNKDTHPFEILMQKLNIKHRYTRPYRPQTNGKVERFWRTLKEEMLNEAVYKDKEEFMKTLTEYLIYYNEHRPHSSLDGKTPFEFNKNCPRIS